MLPIRCIHPPWRNMEVRKGRATAAIVRSDPGQDSTCDGVTPNSATKPSSAGPSESSYKKARILIRIMKTVMIGKEREGMLSRKGIMIVRLASLVLGALLVPSALAADAPQVYRESSDALYNLDFSTAQRGFEELTSQYPDNPDYWNALAS